MSKLIAVPINLKEANEFVSNFHRHNKPVVGAKYSIGCSDGDRLVGTAIVGRPIAIRKDDGVTAEVTRCCVLDDAPKGSCSFLYACCWKACKAMGGQRMITILSCGQCWISIAQILALASVCGGSIVYWIKQFFRR